MGVFEHCAGYSGSREFWMQDALGDVGTSNRGFYHGSLTRDDSISVSRVNQHPGPILAAFLQRSHSYNEFVECEKNIKTTNPKASSLYKDV